MFKKIQLATLLFFVSTYVSNAATCQTTVECNSVTELNNALQDSIGSVSQTINDTANRTKTRQGARKVFDDWVSSTAITDDLYARYSVSEYAVFDGALFAEVGNDATVVSAIKDKVCGSDLPAFCEVTSEIVSGYRRMDEADGAARKLAINDQYKISVTLDVESTAYSSLPDGSFDSADFISTVATALTVDAGNITILDSQGTITVEYIVAVDNSASQDPLDSSILSALTTASTEINALASTVESALGLNSGSISTSSIDKCADRTCYSRGSCNSTTGVCSCTNVDYWGINCETAVDCNSGSKAVDAAYCNCDYPQYGLRCENSLTCSSCNHP